MKESDIYEVMKCRKDKRDEGFSGICLQKSKTCNWCQESFGCVMFNENPDFKNNMSVTKPSGTQCQKCGEFGQDTRILRMSCLYEMSELNVPFVLIEKEKGHDQYTLTVCKDCRGDWMRAIENWFNGRLN